MGGEGEKCPSLRANPSHFGAYGWVAVKCAKASKRDSG